ncbi:HAMP domain-containing protein [Nakamurella antarctica]|uniref:Sensor histidine kinase MtrB n=1 Tax=Nakamurella antarctica TaxID=1902245 RepID=A0A3G8ZJU6_9ACTN|nr:MtrAB system histidine kinase MtrB [Nakamurella antarctica]AZI57480.1 HAMP domain-containing protein [Nakamurella antarctica]
MSKKLPRDDFDDVPTGPIDLSAVRAELAAESSPGSRSRGSRSPGSPKQSRAAFSRRRFKELLFFCARSLRVRVIVATFILSGVVIVALGFVLQNEITSRLLENKRDAAIAESEALRPDVGAALDGADTDPSQLKRLMNRTLDVLTVPGTADSTSQGSTAGVYEPALASTRGLVGEVDVGPIADVPAALRQRVVEGYLSTQYTSVVRNGSTVPALVVGVPVVARGDTTFELYLIYLLTAETGSVAVVQNLLLAGGGVLVVLLTGIAALIAHQVVRPVQLASAAAGRLAAGALDERMPVQGPIEISQLAGSFNGMAEAIKVQIRQLEEFGALQRRFTSDVSHELRTPLTTVRMAADLLFDARADLPSYLTRSTELMVDELDRFEDLLADLLEISRYDAGMAELSAEPIDLRSTIANSVAAVRTIADNAGVHIVVDVPEAPTHSEIDSRRIERILRNLLANAIDHAEGNPILIQLAADSQAAAISVTDSGVGLNPGEAGLVFNRFWRADPSRQRQTGGTGLGLAIAMEDAKLHGGWLQAYGRPGVGSRFRLTLPRVSGTLLTESPLPLAPEESGAEGESEDHTRFAASSPERRYLEDGLTFAAVSPVALVASAAAEQPSIVLKAHMPAETAWARSQHNYDPEPAALHDSGLDTDAEPSLDEERRGTV